MICAVTGQQAKLAFFLSVCLCLNACAPVNLCKVEVKNVPGEKARAVLCENTPDALGATVSFAFAVHVTFGPESLSEKTMVLTAEAIQDVEMKWVDSTTLRVSFRDGRIYSFRNFAYPQQITAITEPIRVMLVDNTAAK